MADLTQNFLNNQKRAVCSSVFSFTGDNAATGDVIGNLPKESLVSRVSLVNTTKGAGTTRVNINGVQVLSPKSNNTDSVANDSSSDYFKTGGPVTITLAGVADAVEASIVVEYVELGKTTGEYTT